MRAEWIDDSMILSYPFIVTVAYSLAWPERNLAKTLPNSQGYFFFHSNLYVTGHKILDGICLEN